MAEGLLMEHLAQRCAAVAAAALTTGGMIAVLTSMTHQSLADVQIREAEVFASGATG